MGFIQGMKTRWLLRIILPTRCTILHATSKTDTQCEESYPKHDNKHDNTQSAGGDPQRAPDAQLRERLGFIQNWGSKPRSSRSSHDGRQATASSHPQRGYDVHR